MASHSPIKWDAMKIFSTKEKGFIKALDAILKSGESDTSEAEEAVKAIINGVRENGDKALLKYTERFDKVRFSNMRDALCTRQEIERALGNIPKVDSDIIKLAAKRIRAFHKKQLPKSWFFKEKNGTLLGQRVAPLERVGIYVPGGKAAYPSTVLMNAIPAKVAGVREIVMASPNPNPLVLAAAALAGVDRVIAIGGAQAVAALAYGTKSIPRVDKIVGPGNVYVAEAKRQVFGEVGIDMLAGPSEILVVSDGRTPADWVAMDLFSQAEHDELAQAILVSPDAAHLDAVERCIRSLLDRLPRRKVIEASLSARGALIHTRDLDEA